VKISFWELEISRYLKFFDQGLRTKTFQIEPYLDYSIFFEKYIIKWGCILKTKICNRNFGHLNGKESNYPSDFQSFK
jgi:hypothetical protein